MGMLALIYANSASYLEAVCVWTLDISTSALPVANQ
jgi:hypothetical protein